MADLVQQIVHSGYTGCALQFRLSLRIRNKALRLWSAFRVSGRSFRASSTVENVDSALSFISMTNDMKRASVTL